MNYKLNKLLQMYHLVIVRLKLPPPPGCSSGIVTEQTSLTMLSAIRQAFSSSFSVLVLKANLLITLDNLPPGLLLVVVLLVGLVRV